MALESSQPALQGIFLFKRKLPTREEKGLEEGNAFVPFHGGKLSAHSLVMEAGCVLSSSQTLSASQPILKQTFLSP